MVSMRVWPLVGTGVASPFPLVACGYVAMTTCRYPGTSFADHIFRYNDDPNVKMMVLLGEVSLCVVKHSNRPHYV